MPEEDHTGSTVDLADGTGSTTAFTSGDLAEKLIALPEMHFQKTCAKRQLLDIKHAQIMLDDKLFYVQVRKTNWSNANATQSSLTILNYSEKEGHNFGGGSDRTHKRPKPLEELAEGMHGETSEESKQGTAGDSEPRSSS